MAKNTGTLSEQLNQLGEEWFEARKRQDKNTCIMLQADIFLLADKIFRSSVSESKKENELFERPYLKGHPDRRAALGEFFIRDWMQFDPNKGTLYNFMKVRLGFRASDMHSKDYAIRKKERKNPQPGDLKTEYIREISLDTPQENENVAIPVWLEYICPLPAEYDLEYNERIAELIALILSLPQVLKGRANTSERVTYFKMFFTDDMVEAIHTYGVTSGYINHERDLFESINISFLDFFMSDICRTANEILHSRLKFYGEIVEGQPMEEPRYPLPNNIYCTYLKVTHKKKVGDSAISNQRNAYHTFLRKMLC